MNHWYSRYYRLPVVPITGISNTVLPMTGITDDRTRCYVIHVRKSPTQLTYANHLRLVECLIESGGL